MQSPFEQLEVAHHRLSEAIGRVIVGQERVVSLMLTALFADGHCLFVGVPGLAKTLLVQTVASAVGVNSGRIQFTPDLMPSDITGVEVMDEDPATGKRSFRFVEGPVFTHLLLADEINRTPPKTQAALLQSMQERTVTAAGRTYALPRPFLVFATQNPIEQEGTYPLPEAQQDRFMFSIPVDYPSFDEEVAILERTTTGQVPDVEAVLTAEELTRLQQLIRGIPVNSDVMRYAVRLASATRRGAGTEASTMLRWGAGPRASQYLVTGARAWAALRGRDVPSPSDVRDVASAVLRHRVVLDFEAEAAGATVDEVIQSLLREVG